MGPRWAHTHLRLGLLLESFPFCHQRFIEDPTHEQTFLNTSPAWLWQARWRVVGWMACWLAGCFLDVHDALVFEVFIFTKKHCL